MAEGRWRKEDGGGDFIDGVDGNGYILNGKDNDMVGLRDHLVSEEGALMKKNEIIDFLRSHKEEMRRRFGVKKIGLFGSYVRGNANEDSDIDIAVEMENRRIFRNFFALEQYLQDHLRKNVDIGIESAIKPAVKKQIMSEIEYV